MKIGSEYWDQHVAIKNEQVIDSDQSEDQLLARIKKRKDSRDIFLMYVSRVII